MISTTRPSITLRERMLKHVKVLHADLRPPAGVKHLQAISIDHGC